MERTGSRQNNTIRFAVTGGIASGKSTVLDVLKEEGFAVFSADDICRRMYDDPRLSKAVLAAIPGAGENGIVNRKQLGAIVFSDPEKRRLLEGLTHPYIMTTLLREMEGAEKSPVFAEVPLLFEGGYERDFDGVLVVLREREDRVRAAAERDGLSREEAGKRLESQFEYDTADLSDYYVVHNSGKKEDLKEKTKKLLRKILADFSLT